MTQSHGVHEGFQSLYRQVPRFAKLSEQFGHAPVRQWPSGFASLVKIIIGQQLSTRAAATIVARLEGLLPQFTPQAMLAQTDESLRSAGLSRAKVRSLRDLSNRIIDGKLNLNEIEHLSDQLVIDRLTEVIGIGPWTAEIYLLFALQRADIWPAADLALMVALQYCLDLPHRPTATEMREKAEAFRPYRSFAAHYLWHLYHCLQHQKTEDQINEKNARNATVSKTRASKRRG